MNTDYNEAVHYVGALDSNRNSRLINPLLFPCPLDDIGPNPSKKLIYKESKILVYSSLPLIIGYLLQNSLSLCTVYFLGIIGSTEQAAAALSNMYAAVTCWSIGMGMATALDTLCSQSFTGSKDQFMMSVYVQRGLLVSTILAVPVVFVWWLSTPVLIFLKVDEKLAQLCGVYLKALIPSILPLFYFECLKKFLQAQGIMNASTYILLIVTPINFILMQSLIFSKPFELGFLGAPIAVSISSSLTLLLIILYIKYVKGGGLWNGLDKRAFSGLASYVKLGLPGVAMVCAEWSAFEIMGLAASHLGVVALATHSVIMTICNLFYMVPLGISIAASNRLGNLLGDQKPNMCKLSSYCSQILSSVFALINTTLLIIFRVFFARILTKDEEVIALASKVIPIAAIFQLFDGFTAVSSGLLRGQGRQNLGALINITTYYLFAIPIGLILAFKVGLGITGLWWGLCLALFTTSVCLMIITSKTNWREQVDKALDRID